MTPFLISMFIFKKIANLDCTILLIRFALYQPFDAYTQIDHWLPDIFFGGAIRFPFSEYFIERSR